MNNEATTPAPVTPTDYTVGQDVFVHAFGHWYAGTVAKLGRTRVHVTYTSGTGTTRTKSCTLDQVALEQPGSTRARRPRRIRQYIQHPITAADPDGMQRAGQLVSGMGFHGVRLLVAFQGLSLPPGMMMTRGATRTVCANIVTEMTGLPCSNRWRPDRGLGTLEEYVAALIVKVEATGQVVEVQAAA